MNGKKMARRRLTVSVLSLCCAAFGSERAGAQTVNAGSPIAPSASSLKEQFRDPPASARPLVWWHWMNGNITKDGIAKDLAWMKRAGIGGAQAFDVNQKTPQIVDRRLIYMTPEWKDAFRFAASEADRLGLELAVATSPGWSATGGPWVPAADGMKKLVWSETIVSGGKRFMGKLAPPPSTTGPFQALPPAPDLSALLGQEEMTNLPTFYADAVVLAVPLPAMAQAGKAIVTDAQGALLNGNEIEDDDITTGVDVVRPKSGAPQLVFDYAHALTVRSARLYMPNSTSLFGVPRFAPRLEAWEDKGRAWRKVADIPLSAVPTTVSFASVSAHRFRLVLDASSGGGAAPSFAPAPGADMSAMGSMMAAMGGTSLLKVGDFRLSSEARVDRSETKAGFGLAPDYYAIDAALPEAIAPLRRKWSI